MKSIIDAISELDSVFDFEVQYLKEKYDRDKVCLFGDESDKIKFNKEYPTIEDYIKKNKKINTINDAFLVLQLAEK